MLLMNKLYKYLSISNDQDIFKKGASQKRRSLE